MHCQARRIASVTRPPSDARSRRAIDRRDGNDGLAGRIDDVPHYVLLQDADLPFPSVRLGHLGPREPGVRNSCSLTAYPCRAKVWAVRGAPTSSA